MHRNLATAVWPHSILTASIAILLGVGIAGLGSGCRKGTPDGLNPVSGQVRLDGKPLEEASITFLSDRDQVPALTDADGRYELKPGAAAGEYRVQISKFVGSPQEMLSKDPGAAGQVPRGTGASGPPKQVIPARYSDPQQTELRFSVMPPGSTRADFDLVTKK